MNFFCLISVIICDATPKSSRNRVPYVGSVWNAMCVSPTSSDDTGHTSPSQTTRLESEEDVQLAKRKK